MNLDNPAALRYLLQEDIYLLPGDRESYLHRTADIPDTQTPEPDFNYLGSYKNAFLILSYYPQQEHMEEAHLTALESTLARIGLSREAVAILNMAPHTGVSYEALTAKLQPQKIVILGADALPAETPFITLNQPQQAENQKLLYTFNFAEMMGNKDNTKLFWNAIKTF